jgi:hypothetical protein
MRSSGKLMQKVLNAQGWQASQRARVRLSCRAWILAPAPVAAEDENLLFRREACRGPACGDASRQTSDAY